LRPTFCAGRIAIQAKSGNYPFKPNVRCDRMVGLEARQFAAGGPQSLDLSGVIPLWQGLLHQQIHSHHAGLGYRYFASLPSVKCALSNTQIFTYVDPTHFRLFHHPKKFN
jgi:hypothetical protein